MIRGIGLVIYTYESLIAQINDLWEWLYQVEQWFGKSFSEYDYVSSLKSKKIIPREVSLINQKRLYKHLLDRKSLSLLSYGRPSGVLSSYISEFPDSLVVTLSSTTNQVSHFSEAYRHPSRITIEVSSSFFENTGKVEELINLGVKAWSIAGGIYGFIDVDTGIPPHDNLTRNFYCIVSNLIPQEHLQEFREWQTIQPKLNKRIWKIFWGNFLSREHLQQLGGYEKLRREDWYRPQPEIFTISQMQGKRIVEEKIRDVVKIANEGCFFRLSASPLDYSQPEIQQRRKFIQSVLDSLSIDHYSL